MAPLSNLGKAWLALSLAVAAHVTDEALTGFLRVYNPTVEGVRQRYSWFPMPTFEFRGWLVGLIVGVALLLLLTPVVSRNPPWMRPFAYFLAVAMTLNGLGHITGTILGHTISSVQFPRPMPGFYSSPLLLIGSGWLLRELRRTRPGSARGN